MNGNPNLKNNKLINIRAFVIILTVFAHSIIIYNPYWNIYTSNTPSTLFKNLCLFIYIFHMPLFFSLSGFLFNKTFMRNNRLSAFSKKKFKRLIIPYLFIGIAWLLPLRYLAKYKGFTKNSVIYNITINIILGNDNGHLWFLMALFLIFLIYFILIKYTKNKKILNILVICLSIFGFLLPSFIGSAFQNLIWFHLGNCIERYELPDKLSKKKAIICLWIVLFLSALYLIIYGKIDYYKYICLVIKEIICLIGIPTIYYFMPNKTIRFIEHIDENSFGVYLFHSPLIYITFSSDVVNYPFLTFFVNFFVFGFCSYIITVLLKKTKLKSLIGEVKKCQKIKN